MEENKRENLPPLQRAVSDTLDDYMRRLHGIISSWAYPDDFIFNLEKRGYTVVPIKKGDKGE